MTNCLMYKEVLGWKCLELIINVSRETFILGKKAGIGN